MRPEKANFNSNIGFLRNILPKVAFAHCIILSCIILKPRHISVAKIVGSLDTFIKLLLSYNLNIK